MGSISVVTIETYESFRSYAKCLKDAGFFVPASWVWGL